MKRICVLLPLLGMLLVGLPGLVFAEPDVSSLFIDLDGDGLDDFLVDFQDGFFILDHRPQVEAPVAGIGGATFDAFAAMEMTTEDLPQINKDEFVQRSFNSRSINCCRGDFDSDFGGTDASSGKSSGKTCVGGVCY